jgi:hypothetical protein
MGNKMATRKKKEVIEDRTITIDGVDHSFNAMNDEAKLAVHQINVIDQEVSAEKLKIDRLENAKQMYVIKLKDALEEAEEVLQT